MKDESSIRDIVGKRIEYECPLSQSVYLAVVLEQIADNVYKVKLITNQSIRHIGEGQIKRILRDKNG